MDGKRAREARRGGLRVIYHYRLSTHQLWLLILYGKNEVENIPNNVLKKIREELER